MKYVDEDDDLPITGGTVEAEWRAIADGNGEPLISNSEAMSHPDFPANTIFATSGSQIALYAWAKIQWFRNNCKGWTVITEEVEVTEMNARFRATIMDSMGRIRQTATKSWSKRKPGSGAFYIECAETSAVSRALELLGFSAERAKVDKDYAP